MNRKIKIVIVYLILILISISCGSKKIEYPAPSIKTIDGSFVSDTGTFQFGGKGYRADFGTITVPENRNNAASRLIHLHVIRIHARTENHGEPLFGLSGGPGQTNMDWSPIDSLLYDHDFVMVGYRGVDGSTVLDCPEVAEALKNSSGKDLLSEESLKRIGQAWKASVHRLISEGVDLNGYTIPEIVEDIEAVRRIFKYNKINLISGSFGTRVAYIYGLMHPEKIHRSVMIGVNPPSRFIWDPKRTDEQINYYSRLWSKDSVMSSRCPDLAATMKKVLNNIPPKWLFFTIDPGKVKTIAFCLLFQRNTAAMVFDAFVAADNGDYSGLAMMSMAFNYTLPSMFVWGDLASKALSADFDSWKNYSGGMKLPNEILGSPLNELLWKPLMYSRFPMKTISKELQSTMRSEVETLLLSGSVDFSTPAELGAELLPYLKNGKQIILSEYGHVGDILYLRQGIIEQIITNYFNTGNADTTKIEYVPMDFHVSWGFPMIAKITLGAIAIIIIVLLLVIVWVFKKIKRKRMKSSLMINEST